MLPSNADSEGNGAITRWNRTKGTENGASPIDRLKDTRRELGVSQFLRRSPSKVRRLPIIGACAVLALEVLVQELLFDRLEVRRELKRHQRHLRDALDGDRVL
jgi:hypothetical protein